ncbi:MAG TPA: hypothetical protein VJJ22_04550 [Candidatus Paceibacterota bacterium]
MNTKYKIIVLVLIALAIGGGYFLLNRKVNDGNGNGVCTADVKLCPDGSYVGRTGPNCEFPECPIADNGNNATSTQAKLGKLIFLGDIAITPLEVIQDSRCATDVTCVWAGTVELKVKLENVVSSRMPNDTTTTITLGESLPFANKLVTLESVEQYPISTKTILPADYIFTFSVK